MSIEIHTNNDGSVALDLIIEKNHGFELWEIVQAIEDHTIRRCALIAFETDPDIGECIQALQSVRPPKPERCDGCSFENGCDESIQRQWSSGNPVHTSDLTDQPDNDKGHVLSIQGDEYICSRKHCGKRWGFDDTDVPDCGGD